MLIIVRVHYTIDVFAALFIGLFVHSLVKHNLAFFDKIMGFVYITVKFIIKKVK
jgi:hypothetical protein